MVKAPWSAEQVDNLNRYQHSGIMHPFTCPGGHDGDRELVATRNGWICCHCDYRQDWAHDFMCVFDAEAAGKAFNVLLKPPQRIDDNALNDLVKDAGARYDALDPQQKAQHDYEQRRSLVRGLCPTHMEYTEWCGIVDTMLPPTKPT